MTIQPSSIKPDINDDKTMQKCKTTPLFSLHLLFQKIVIFHKKISLMPT